MTTLEMLLSMFLVVDGDESYTQIKEHCIQALASIDKNKENGECCVKYLQYQCDLIRCQQTSGKTKEDCNQFWHYETVADYTFLGCDINATNFHIKCSNYDIEEANKAASDGEGIGKVAGVVIGVIIVIVVLLGGIYYWFYVRRPAKLKHRKEKTCKNKPEKSKSSKSSKKSKSSKSKHYKILSKVPKKSSLAKPEEENKKAETKDYKKFDAKKDAIVKSGKVDFSRMMKAIEL